MSAEKKKGGFLARKAKKEGEKVDQVEYEASLVKQGEVRIEDIVKLKKITDQYLCQVKDNVYNIDFTKFKIRDIETGGILFEISKPEGSADDVSLVEDPNAGRYVRYEFPPEFLNLRTIGATVEFTVGEKPVSNFRMIERHYFKDKLIKSFDFDFGYCMPNSVNTCEHIYELPNLSKENMNEMIKCPFQTKSDSFYFVDGKLIMHNKADYAYNAGV